MVACFKTNGGDVLVDDCDAALVTNKPYVITGTYSKYVAVCFRGKKQRLSRLIMRPEDGLVVDHINGNPLDNRRANLRVCTVQQNNWNRKRRPGGRSRFKGVTRGTSGWIAFIAPNGSQKHLGTFATEEDAARAYDAAAAEAYGQFACLNFPNDGERSALDHEANNAD